MIIPTWSTEKEDKGYALVLKEQFIELTIYDIPATSYSAGGMYSYAVQDFDENTEAWKQISAIWGENVAREVLRLCLQTVQKW